MRNKLLLPDGQMLSQHAIDNLSIKQVFNILIKLGVSTKSQSNEFHQPRSRSRTSSRTRIIYRAITPRPVPARLEYVYPFYNPEATRPWRGPKRYSPHRTIVPKRYSPNRSIACTDYRSKNGCESNDCYWTGTSCLTK